jgi:hypothetical protein
MSRRHTLDLARLCTQLVRKGNDFPTVWGTLLKGHSLVNGPPRQHHNGIRSVLEIHLFTGERLVFDAEVPSRVVLEFGVARSPAFREYPIRPRGQ